MNLIKCYQANSSWYKNARCGSTPVGVLWHDTGAGNPNLKRYVQPHETDSNYQKMLSLLGKNKYNNDWNHIDHDAGLNAWIGLLEDGTVATVQASEWDKHPWGCGGGHFGSCNGYIKENGATTWVNQHWIQFECCDDGYKDEAYFKRVYKEACEFTSYICELYSIDPFGKVVFNGIEVPTILCHADSHSFGLGNNHGDVYPWFNKFGYNMDDVRRDVAVIMSKKNNPNSEAAPQFSEGDTVRLKDGVTKYYNGTPMASWVPKEKLYVRGFKDGDKVIISTLRDGAITGVVYASDLILEEKNVAAPEYESAVTAPLNKPSGTASNGSEEEAEKLWNFLLDKIGNEYGVAGLMGNLYAESALRSDNLQGTYEKTLGYTDETYTAAVDGGDYSNFVNDSAGYGLAQWTYWSRKQALLEYATSIGKSICDFDMQMEFLWSELSCNYKSTLQALRNATSVVDASTYVLIHFESPADQGEDVQATRTSYGQRYYDTYHTGEFPPSDNQTHGEITNSPNENDKVEQPPVNAPTGEDAQTRDDETPTYIKTPKEAQNFIIRLFNHIIDFIVRNFKK